jgi:hypothetical protein
MIALAKLVFIQSVLFGLPAYLVWRLRGVGIVIGTLLMWLLGFLIAVYDHVDVSGQHLAVGMWMFFGWLFSLLYCLFVFCIRYLCQKISAKKSLERTGAAPPSLSSNH